MSDFFNVEKMKFIDKFFDYIDYKEICEKDEYLILDLRTYKEFNYKHLENSVHFPLLDDKKSLKLEGMFENKTYFSTMTKSIIYILPKLYTIIKKIKIYEKNKIVVLACRHARIRSRGISMIANILGSKTLVLKYGVNSILNINKKDVL
ncbi:rhodanese-like domain-containing protein [Clostridium sp. LIBA-8841]|uniref:rhodanese-like domain-containing protein n=1 Tax=Clostridium sp. LIBA-8841 TaxID=2987530 RepID=UPI002AC50A5B|nr:rhodanese-like domain-containing protein [Clostridium sp. LIBA-8841]MDZ5253429.1 rhodanese-like domain-containing protein [Clostridium sp. LIBA-8841]